MEPAVQRRQVHPRRRPRPGGGPARGGLAYGPAVEIAVIDTGEGITPGVPAARLRALPPGGRLDHPPARRAGAGAGDRQAPGRAARRHDLRRQRRPRPRGDVHRHPPAAPSPPSAPRPGSPHRRPLPSACRPASPPARIAAAVRGLRVLVVDDDPDARDLIRRILERCEAEVTAAGSAAEALDLLARVHPGRAAERHRHARPGRLRPDPQRPRHGPRRRAHASPPPP